MIQPEKRKRAYIVAGGTGGHINAALAIGEEAEQRGYEVSYLTGKRPLDYKLYAGKNVQHLESWPLRTFNPLKFLSSVLKNLMVFIDIRSQLKDLSPDFVLGAGGYVCGPSLLAAKSLGIPSFIIEQNAVMGLTNKLLGRLATKIFTHFQHTTGLSPRYLYKVVVTGNPVRSSIEYSPPRARASHEPIRVLVFGGSLGAKQINEFMENLIQTESKPSLHIIHQLGKKSEFRGKIATSITYEAKEYIDNMAELYRWCDCIIARAGASTISELRIVRKPCLLIPFPLATDDHQTFNAHELQRENITKVFITPAQATKEDLKKSFDRLLDYQMNNTIVSEVTVGDRSMAPTQKVIEEILLYVCAHPKN
jgi:UDP-N-acetylglucosamine--N-acetylmuramyl-(pentapeptide) pyrophosphoryl-undecaprenol N-acetylglucosamine transferase